MRAFRRAHLPSVGVGAVLVAVVVVLLGMRVTQQAVSPQQAVALTSMRVQYVPDPTSVVNLVEGSAFEVPSGKSLIITDWAVSDPRVAVSPTNPLTIQPRIRVNGADRWGGGFGSETVLAGGNSIGSATTGGGFLYGALFSGVKADGGQVVTLAANANYPGPVMFASGYLTSAQQPKNVVRMRFIPSPNDVVNIESGLPYAVPPGKVLIVTDWACTDANVLSWPGSLSLNPRVRVDGIDRWAGGFDHRTNFGGPAGMYVPETTAGGSLSGTLVSGIRSDAGQVVSLEVSEGPLTKLFASGYLVDANP